MKLIVFYKIKEICAYMNIEFIEKGKKKREEMSIKEIENREWFIYTDINKLNSDRDGMKWGEGDCEVQMWRRGKNELFLETGKKGNVSGVIVRKR